MLKREDKEIDGLTYTCVQFPAMYAFGLLARLAKSVGPALASLSGLSPETELLDAGPALHAALASLDPDDAQKLVIDILKSTSVQIGDATGGRKLEFVDKAKIDEVFSGHLTSMFKVIGFALQTNFADFKLGNDKLANVVPALRAHSA